jgi:hypothetical protein
MLASVLSGCAQDDYLRTEGLTLEAGDSVARNSMLQIIDPWPQGVEDAQLLPPADRQDGTEVTASEPAAAAGQP